jgi:ATP-dependent DNA helicase PIF1
MTGVITSILPKDNQGHISIAVKLDSGTVVIFEPEPFEVRDGNGIVVFTRRQIPLALGWALSIHKAQGMSLDQCTVDLFGVFACHQAYVAISRCKELENSTIHCPKEENPKFSELFSQDPRCLDFERQ